MHRHLVPILLALVLHGIPSLAAPGLRQVGDTVDGQTFSLGVPSGFKEEFREVSEKTFLISLTDESQRAAMTAGAGAWTEPQPPDLKEYERQIAPLTEKTFPDAVPVETTEGTLNGFRTRTIVLGGSASGMPIDGTLMLVDADSLLFFFMWVAPKETGAEVKQAILKGLAQLQVNFQGGMNLGALQEHEKRCRKGTASACTPLGYSQLIAEDAKSGQANLQKACKGGDALGCRLLGTFHSVGRTVPKDEVKAAQLYELGCKRGDGLSCTYLGEAFEDGVGVAKSPKRVIRLYEQACTAKEPYGCSHLAKKLWKGDGVARSHARALGLFQKACDGSLARACAYAADMIRNGEGRSKDDTLARKYLERGCDLGDSWACGTFGFYLLEGIAGEKDPARALTLFKRACTAGDPQGCRLLADATLEQEDADASEAARLYGQACDKQDGQACLRLSQLYEAGNGVTKDTARSAELRKKACAAGLKEACPAQGASSPGR